MKERVREGPLGHTGCHIKNLSDLHVTKLICRTVQIPIVLCIGFDCDVREHLKLICCLRKRECVV